MSSGRHAKPVMASVPGRPAHNPLVRLEALSPVGRHETDAGALRFSSMNSIGPCFLSDIMTIPQSCTKVPLVSTEAMITSTQLVPLWHTLESRV